MDERTVTHIPAKLLNVPRIDRPFHVAAYCRVSSPSEKQELSLETQVTYYTDKINGNELWVNVGVFADTATGVSRQVLSKGHLAISILFAMGIVSMKQSKRW